MNKEHKIHLRLKVDCVVRLIFVRHTHALFLPLANFSCAGDTTFETEHGKYYIGVKLKQNEAFVSGVVTLIILSDTYAKK